MILEFGDKVGYDIKGLQLFFLYLCFNKPYI